MLVLHHRQIGVVDTGEGPEALGVGLAGTGPQNDPAVKDDLHAAAAPAGIEKGVGEVAFGVGAIEPDGLLGAGEDNGLGAVLNQIAQGRRRIGHGVRAVADDEAVVVVVVLPDGLGRPQPVGGMDAGAVQTIQLDAVHMAQLGDAGEIGQQLVGVQLRCQALRRHLRGDGAAGADHEDLFHGAGSSLTACAVGSKLKVLYSSRFSSAAKPNRAACSSRGFSSSGAASYLWRRSRRNNPRRVSSPQCSHRSRQRVVRSCSSR